MTQFYPAVQGRQALAGARRSDAGTGDPAVAGRPRQTGRPVRMHHVRLLLDRMPLVLVESRQVPWPPGAADRLAFPGRYARPGHGRAPGRTRGAVQAVPLPHHHELRRGLPEKPESHQGHRSHQEPDAEERHLIVPGTDALAARIHRLARKPDRILRLPNRSIGCRGRLRS